MKDCMNLLPAAAPIGPREVRCLDLFHEKADLLGAARKM
jgi:hypothetical protein